MKHKPIIIAASVMLALLACGILFFVFIAPFLVNRALHDAGSFDEKCEFSHDSSLALRSYSKDDKDGVNSLYFAVTKGGDREPLFVSDCEYRMFDFQFLGWGQGTYDVWAVSGDIGTFCYVYQGDNQWMKCGVRYGTKSGDFVWTLEREAGEGIVETLDMPCISIPSEVIAYKKQWEDK